MNAVTGFKAKLRSVTGYGKPGFVKTGCGFAEENAKIKAGLQKRKIFKMQSILKHVAT